MLSSTPTGDTLKAALLALLHANDSRSDAQQVQVRVMSDGGSPSYAIPLGVAMTLTLAAKLSHITGRLIFAQERSFLLFEHNVRAILKAAATQKEP